MCATAAATISSELTLLFDARTSIQGSRRVSGLALQARGAPSRDPNFQTREQSYATISATFANPQTDKKSGAELRPLQVFSMRIVGFVSSWSVHLGNIITEWNQQLDDTEVTTLRCAAQKAHNH